MKHTPPSTTKVAGSAGALFVTVEGEGGLPILFVHDNAADRSVWEESQHALQTRTVALDLRGLGSSAGNHGPFGVEAGVEDVAAVADALLPATFVLVGHGFGAAVAGAFAAYYPERLAGLLYVEGRAICARSRPTSVVRGSRTSAPIAGAPSTSTGSPRCSPKPSPTPCTT